MFFDYFLLQCSSKPKDKKKPKDVDLAPMGVPIAIGNPFLLPLALANGNKKDVEGQRENG
jgi:hypothetical protein